MNWLLERVDRFWPDWLIIVWARAAIALGAIFVILVVVMAVRHYGYGHPILDSNTHEPLTPAKSTMWFLALGGGGAFFLVLGVLVSRWKSG